MSMSCHILVVNDKKNATSIKNLLFHQSVSHVYTKLMETNEIINGARF